MKHWVFDLDGTLVDSFSHYFVSLEGIFRSHGSPFSSALRHAALTQPIPDFLESHLGAKAVPAALTMLQKQSNEDAAHIQPFVGISELIAYLKSAGARIAVWTNRDLTSSQLILEQTGLARFAELCVSGTCVPRKPDPAGLRRILGRFGCEADAVTVIGDHENDVLAAKSLGAKTVRASWHSYWELEPCAHADRQFYNVADFSTWARMALAAQGQSKFRAGSFDPATINLPSWKTLKN